MKIVIVDDDPIALALLEANLKTGPHTVFATSDPAVALARLNEGFGQVLISDWEMPELSGLELCQRVRAEVAGRYVYIMLLTSRSGVENLVDGLSAGADDFLTKPFDPFELRARIRTAERIVSIETRELMIFGMAKLAESRDNETGAHLERVREYCRLLTLELQRNSSYSAQINPEFVRLIYLTSPLHDIGKVGIPDCVLLKPAQLSEQEFAIMKTHTQIGAETLEKALHQFPQAPFLKMALEIALSHHEKWDGSGYPRGLSGADIPLAARIMAVADVYDALRTRRVYKASFTPHVARSIIEDGSGKHFDPEIVAAFQRIEPAFCEVAERFGAGVDSRFQPCPQDCLASDDSITGVPAEALS